MRWDYFGSTYDPIYLSRRGRKNNASKNRLTLLNHDNWPAIVSFFMKHTHIIAFGYWRTIMTAQILLPFLLLNLFQASNLHYTWKVTVHYQKRSCFFIVKCCLRFITNLLMAVFIAVCCEHKVYGIAHKLYMLIHSKQLLVNNHISYLVTGRCCKHFTS